MDNNKQGYFFVSPYPARPLSPWKLEIRARFAGKKIRRFFKTEFEAWSEGERLTGQIRERGVSSLESTGLTVAAAVKRFRANKKFKGQHGQHMARNLDLFLEKYGSRSIEGITPFDLQAFWNRPEWPDGKSTRFQAFVYLRIFFNWMERYDLIERNITRRVDPPTKPGPLSDILTVKQMKELLGMDGYLLAFACLGGLAGLRTSEILRIDARRDLDWKGKEIHVNRGKTGERYVKMEPAFIRHCPRKFDFPNQRNFYASLRKAVLRTSIVKLPQNVLRHSWFTYHLAKWKNAAVTATEGGNSEKMVKRVYALAARRADAAAWWRL